MSEPTTTRTPTMEYRTLGGGSAVVPTYALGTMTLGAETDEAGAFAQLDAFVEGAAGLHLSPEETARLDAASDPQPADHPYGGPGTEQRSRKLAGGR